MSGAKMLSVLTPAAEHGVLSELLRDEAVRPAVVATMQRRPSQIVKGYQKANMKTIRANTQEMKDPDDYREKKMIEVHDHARELAPSLADVEKPARIPCPGSAAAALELLLRIGKGSVPDYENVEEEPEWREDFDIAIDDLTTELVRRRRQEEGDAFRIEPVLSRLRGIAGELARPEFRVGSWCSNPISCGHGWAKNYLKKRRRKRKKKVGTTTTLKGMSGSSSTSVLLL
ncbi:hypothetical protein BD413DRAFT_497622 [Trametes elegans]|nr:hypothetical protein BD413DRAFT_497622 [Trametes elegans]